MPSILLGRLLWRVYLNEVSVWGCSVAYGSTWLLDSMPLTGVGRHALLYIEQRFDESEKQFGFAVCPEGGSAAFWYRSDFG